MATIQKFEDIVAWQKARELNKRIYLLTTNSAIAKDYGLRDQMRRCSISVMSNIAEGFERTGDKEFARFLSIAMGSCAELKSQLYAALDVGFITEMEFNSVVILVDETGKLIQSFRKYLRLTD
ncbi:MAG: four helix bundle protein [Bacteroidetes bacterium]|nr:four helix bundle protein [Bacteroidota bacterium]